MKRTLFIICCFFAIGLVSISFTSCNSCGDTERFVDDIGYGSWDFDGDGNAGGQINFRGKACNGSVGCSCTGFQPITDGDVWQRDYCRKCSHSRSVHK